MNEEQKIAYLNKRVGTDVKARFAKLDEEYNELVKAVKQDNRDNLLEELADVNLIIFHIAAMLGKTPRELLALAIDKMQGREKNPDYKRKCHHKQHVCGDCSYFGYESLFCNGLCELRNKITNAEDICELLNP